MTFFDTNATCRRLIAGGFTEEQAETAVTVAADVAGATLATKGDLEALRLTTKADLREALQQQTNRVGGMMVLAVGIVLAGVGFMLQLVSLS